MASDVTRPVPADDRPADDSGEIFGLFGLESRLLELVDAAVMAVDLSGVVLYANRYCERLYGWSPEELVGRSAAEVAAISVEPALQAEIAKSIAAGGSWEGLFEVRRKDGVPLAVRAIDSPLFDAAGNLVGVVSAAIDATAENRTQSMLLAQTRTAESFRFLAECSAALAASLDYGAGFERLASLAVPFLADLCLIDVADAGVIRRMAAAHAHPAMKGLVDQLGQYPPDPNGAHPVVQTIRTGQTAMLAQMPDDFLAATTRDADHFRLVRRLGFRSFMCVPLQARGHTLGAITLVSCSPTRRFGDDDLVLAKELAWRAALALDNARLYSERSHVAEVLQASLMPPSLPRINGVEMAARYVAAGEGNEVGGDFYDIFDIGYGTWALAIGDVCGRGPEAAVLTGLVRHSLHSLALKERSPSRMLASLNELLQRELEDRSLFCTLSFGVLRTGGSGLRLSLASAGHPPPLVLRHTGGIEEMTGHGALLGVLEHGGWTSSEVLLRPGDTAVFYTDGIVEARAGRAQFGDDRLKAALAQWRAASAQTIADQVVAAVEQFAGRPPRDDMAVLVIRAQQTTQQ